MNRGQSSIVVGVWDEYTSGQPTSGVEGMPFSSVQQALVRDSIRIDIELP